MRQFSEPYPDQPTTVARPACEQQKVLVFADDDSVVGRGVIPNGDVVGRAEADLQHVNAVEAPAPEVDGQRQRELVVDEQLHDVRSTT